MCLSWLMCTVNVGTVGASGSGASAFAGTGPAASVATSPVPLRPASVVAIGGQVLVVQSTAATGSTRTEASSESQG